MTEKLSDQSLNLKTNFMRTRNYLLIICLFLTFCQGCVKELHELPPRPSLVVKLNGVEKDSIIVSPGEEVKIDIDFIANKGFIRNIPERFPADDGFDRVTQQEPVFPLVPGKRLPAGRGITLPNVQFSSGMQG